MNRTRSTTHRRWIAWLPALALSLACVGGARAAASPLAVFSDWWLNPNYSEHGKSIDTIFYFVFWLTTIIMVAVEIVLVWFLFKYRHRNDGRKAIYSHGNTKLEMIWTIIPAIILIVLALWTKRVWDNYRYSPIANDPNAPRILVIGEQYQWSVLYGGTRNKIGRFLVYPKTTDLTWPTVPDGQSFTFPAVNGPAYLPEDQAQKYLNDYIATVNPLGRDYSDPDTNPDPTGENAELAKLNDRSSALGRLLILPKQRPVEIQLGSRDVIHDFFLPNFRSRLDVVPGMRGKLYVTASAECPGPKFYTLAELDVLVKNKQKVVAIVNKAAGGELYRPGRRKPQLWRLKDNNEKTFIVNGTFITPEIIQAAKEANIPSIFSTIAYDLVCEELCGLGHATMQGNVIVLDEATLSAPPYDIYFPPVAKPAPLADGSPGNLAVAQPR